MKKSFLLACLFLPALGLAQPNEDAIPIFNLDDYYVEPKMNLSVGFRALTGPKLAFIGSTGVTSSISSTQATGDPAATGIVRNYHDGYIALDQRVDADGNPVNDGKTNNWLYVDNRQLQETGELAFHAYSAQITDNFTRQKDPGNSYGMELIFSRDLGKIGERLHWKLFAGFSVNGVNVATRDSVTALITTLTDRYSMNGQEVPTAPYTAPAYTTDLDGNTVETSVLIGQKPDSRTLTTRTDDVSVTSYWKLKGSYITLRAGPSVTYNIGERFRLSVSAGPAVVYVGTNYSLEQTLRPDTAADITATINDLGEDFLTGYYVDANVEYLFTDRAGLYLGAFFQGSGQYNQDLSAQGSSYSTELDLNSLKGLRAGLNYRF
jgi:hypothetical protein